MATKTLAGVTVDVTDEGYFTDSTKWNPDMAHEMAKEAGLTLTPKHLEVINFIREKQQKGEGLTIRAIGKSGITDIKGFYELFPGAPLKLASKFSGIPKPASCV